MKTIFLSLVLLLVTYKGVETPQRKVISDHNFNYLFYVSDKKVTSFNNRKAYFYFRSGAIHNAFGGSNGQLLHGDYEKSYTSNQIAEKGQFKNGLKNNIWKSWYENGKLKEIVSWKNGYRSGVYRKYNEDGILVLTGKYGADKKKGRWLVIPTKDTIRYKKGLKIEKERPEKKDSIEEPGKLKRVYTKVKNKVSSFFKKLFTPKKEKEAHQSKKKNTQKKAQKIRS